MDSASGIFATFALMTIAVAVVWTLLTGHVYQFIPIGAALIVGLMAAKAAGGGKR